MEKNEIYELDIIDNGINFEGIAKDSEGKTIFISNALKGEKVQAKILKVNKSYSFGKIERILGKSPDRVDAECEYFPKCGGCDALHTTYENTLNIKKTNATNTLQKQGIDILKVKEIYGMGNPYYYRNKVQYPVRSVNGKTVMGMFAKRTHSIIENKYCLIQDKITHEVAREIFSLILKYDIKGYDEEKNIGEVRNVIVRRGTHTGQVMCVLVVTSEKLKENKRILNIVQDITEKYSCIESFILNVNKDNTNAILTDKNICVYGKEYIIDVLGEHNFKITADSFFQVNTIQAELLYNLLKQGLKLNKDKSLLELYSGVGSIGMFLADSVKNVYAVEIVESAVSAAVENAKINGIDNVVNVVGDATKETLKLLNSGTSFDYLVVDPPRKGLDLEGIELILKLKPKKMGYVSCNVATLARDLKLLSVEYDVQSIEFVDMFPWTSHIECVAVLSFK